MIPCDFLSTSPNVSLGCYPGLTHADALTRGLAAAAPASVQHVQLCPQNHGRLDEAAIAALVARVPAARFRFHANVRIDDGLSAFDAAMPWQASAPYFKRLAALNRELHRQPYSLHAGERADGSLESMADNLRRIRDTMEVQVAVEGLYPVAGRKYLIDSWEEYAWLLESGLDYALDLSHVNIVAHRSFRIERGLTRELLASPRCIELHLSMNDGRSDVHARIEPGEPAWWMPLLDARNPDAAVFVEGNEMRKPVNAAEIRRRVEASLAHQDRLDVRESLEIA